MLVSRTLGDYEVIKQIGQGTLGSVLLAEHRFLKQQYVLKVLPEELSKDRAFVQRFEEEIGRLAALEHPHIVKVHNVSFSDGAFFLVCDCVVDGMGETTNLGHYLRQLNRPLSEEEALRILTQVAEALDYAHTLKGVEGDLVHRGLKMSNILVSTSGNQEIDVHLSDFGLSKVIGVHAVLTRIIQNLLEGMGLSESISDEKYTPGVDGQKLGTLHQVFMQNYVFLAPEQKWPDRISEVGPASDVFAFGVLAYHLLTGKYPEGVFESVADLRSEFKRSWDGLISKCLSSTPSKRPAILMDALDTMTDRERKPAVGMEPQEVPSKYFVSLDPSPKPVLESARVERPSYDPDPAAALAVDPSVTTYQPEPTPKKEKVEPLLTDMIIIKGGTYKRGSNEGSRDEMPYHSVNVDSFAIDTHPVTNEQFVRFLEVMGGEKDVSNHDMLRFKDSRIKCAGGRYTIESGYTKHPVVGITWYGAVAYARWVGKRLPTEAEWEIAAMGGKEGISFPTGDSIEKSQANFFSSDTTPVMSYSPSDAGLFDLAGNVYEWCQDWYGYNFYETSVQEPDNPKGPLQGVYRVLRGGCWKSLKEDLRCAHRHRNNPGTVNSTYGFRCATEVR